VLKTVKETATETFDFSSAQLAEQFRGNDATFRRNVGEPWESRARRPTAFPTIDQPKSLDHTIPTQAIDHHNLELRRRCGYTSPLSHRISGNRLSLDHHPDLSLN
jgi:hypothetical protein